MTRPKVLVTGSSGLIGEVLSAHLSGEFALVGFDRRRGGIPGTCADLLDRDALTAACQGVDAIIHLAAVSRVDAEWVDVLFSNVAGTVNVFEAARQAGVGRVIVASSNHVVGCFELEHAPDLYSPTDRRMIGVEEPIRPDSPYGVSKAFGEAVGRFAFEMYGIRVVCLRLGSVLDRDDPWDAAMAEGGGEDEVGSRFRRYCATWLSHRDCAGLMAAALRADVGFAVVYGVSANPTRFWDLEPGRHLLGWWPVDAAPTDRPT